MIAATDEAQSPSDLAENARRRFGPFVRSEVNRDAEDRDAQAVECPREVIRAAFDVGLFGYALPTELGGGGADPFEWGLVLEQLGYLSDDCSFPALLSARVWMTDTLFQLGRPTLLERYVQPMARAELFGAFAYSDGADPFAFSSTVRQHRGLLALHGEKHIVTGATTADVFLVFLHDEDRGDLCAVLVERTDDGVEVEAVDSLGMRGLGLGSLRFDGVCIPADRMVVDVDGVTFAQHMLNARRLLLVAPLVGAMQRLHEHCVDQLGGTQRYGMPLTDFQNVQTALGRQLIDVECSRAVLHRALSVLAGRQGGLDPAFDPIISSSKHDITNRAVDLAISALRLLGGRGYLRGRSERFLRDACALLAAGGTQDVLEIDLGMLAVAARHERSC